MFKMQHCTDLSKIIILLIASIFPLMVRTSKVSEIKSRPLLATRYHLETRTDPSYQLNPSTILWPPDCIKGCFGSATVRGCTVEYCSKKVALTCWTHYSLIDLQCLCKSMTSTCSSCSGINQELYLAWLYIYCKLSPTWDGLPQSWNAALPSYQTLQAGKVNAVVSSDSSHIQTDNLFTSQFETNKHTFIDDHHLPTCTSGCKWLNGRWTSSFVDGSVAAALDDRNVFAATYGIGGAPQSGKLYVDLSLFCLGWAWKDLQANCANLCNSKLEPTSLLLWLQKTCGNITGFAGLPDNWSNSVAVVNGTFSALFDGPSCLKGSSSTDCQLSSMQSTCMRTLCSTTDPNGDCTSVSMIDLECFCSLGAKCVANSAVCGSATDRTGLFLWLDDKCGSSPGFSLPDGWRDSLAIVNRTFFDAFSEPSCLSNNSNCRISAEAANCTKTLCSSVDRNGGCVAVTRVNKQCFCSTVDYGTCITVGSCNSNLGKTGLLSWLNSTCGNVTGFVGMPENWKATLSFPNSSFSDVNSFPWPNCLDTGHHTDCQLKSIESGCTRSLCGNVSFAGDCFPLSKVEMACFCSQVTYGTTCTANCLLSWQRTQHLNWINNTCSSQVAPGISLPLKWTSLLPVQRSEMLPWNWKLASTLPSSDQARPHCPSASRILLAFAVVNILMSPLLLVIGRRTFIKKISCGYFGQQESTWWYFTGPIGVGLHLASNAINAAIIKGTPGYEQTSIKTLTILWCTRPRISWLIVAWSPYQADRSMYLSATASILFSEVILQFFAGYYMVFGADYARRQKYFLEGHLGGNWYAKQAMIMYAGSMLWLTAVPLAIAACLWTAYGVSKRIGQLGEYWTTTTRVAKRNNAGVTSIEEGINRILSRIKRNTTRQEPWQQRITTVQNHIITAANAAVRDCSELKGAWQSMRIDQGREQKERRLRKAEAQKAKSRLDHAKEGTEEWRERRRVCDRAEQEEMRANLEWSTTTPTTNQTVAQSRQADIEAQIASSQEIINEAKTLLADCALNIRPLKNAIAEAEARVANDEAQIQTIKAQQSNSTNTRELHRLRIQIEEIGPRRIGNEDSVQTARSNPQLRVLSRYEEEIQAVIDSWDVLTERKRELRDNWAAYGVQWAKVAKARRVQQVTKAKVGHFPIVVILGMLLCWIAQWLWWAGYVGVAGDGYCPPKLPVLASIWTIFSSMGAIVGASF